MEMLYNPRMSSSTSNKPKLSRLEAADRLAPDLEDAYKASEEVSVALQKAFPRGVGGSGIIPRLEEIENLAARMEKAHKKAAHCWLVAGFRATLSKRDTEGEEPLLEEPPPRPFNRKG